MLEMYNLLLVSVESIIINYGNVSRDLQTRKTIKIAWCFRKFHYNRDSNTNGYPLVFGRFRCSPICSRARTPSELTPRQIKIEPNRSNTISSPVSSPTYSEQSFWEPKQNAVIAWRRGHVFHWFCYNVGHATVKQIMCPWESVVAQTFCTSSHSWWSIA